MFVRSIGKLPDLYPLTTTQSVLQMSILDRRSLLPLLRRASHYPAVVCNQMAFLDPACCTRALRHEHSNLPVEWSPDQSSKKYFGRALRLELEWGLESE